MNHFGSDYLSKYSKILTHSDTGVRDTNRSTFNNRCSTNQALGINQSINIHFNIQFTLKQQLSCTYLIMISMELFFWNDYLSNKIMKLPYSDTGVHDTNQSTVYNRCDKQLRTWYNLVDQYK